MEREKVTGYPSVDRPWLKYYSLKTINAPMPECTMYEYLVQNSSACPRNIAISFFGSKVTYQELLEKIRNTASAFAALGIKSGDIVAIALPNIPENIYCIYALNMLGAIADMIDLRSRGDVLLHYIKESGTKIAVICDLFAKNMYDIVNETELETLILIQPLASLPFPYNLYKCSAVPQHGISANIIRWRKFGKICKNVKTDMNRNADSVACIAHTSGTTSKPKGVMLTNRQINSLVAQYVSIGFAHEDSDCMLNQVPPFLAYSFLSFHFPFALHMTITLLPDYRPDKFASNLQKYAPNHVFAGPGDWENLLTKQKQYIDYSMLKSLASGSDHLDVKVKEKITDVLQRGGCFHKILEGYGMTECCSAAATQLPSHIVDSSIGVPLPQNIFCIYDNDAKVELPYNTIGEICICGPCVMKGYFNNPIETNNVLKIHSDGKLWLHSGDLGKIDHDGNIYLVGRMKRIIVRYDGIKVYPINVENAVMKHPAISACCTVGVTDSTHGRGQVPVVFAVFNHVYDTAAVIEELKVLCADELAEAYRPRAFYLVDTMPLTPNGKVDFRELERMAEEKMQNNNDRKGV